ncbi:MAG TPA: ACP S-malonyltransferase [Actinomycetota bacterium]|nr:ACP S-malonyltransferase [Actinomycetota bacterium]
MRSRGGPRPRGRGHRLLFAAGHSLGEFVALAFAGATEPMATLRVVVERGAAMHDAGEENPGTMTALVGISPAEAEEIVRVAGRGDVLTVANENSPKQTVVSGTIPAIERVEDLVRSRGAKAVRLKVAGAFHSSLMQPAAGRVRKAISALDFRQPRFPVVANASGRPTDQPSALRDLLGRHIVSPVKWERSMKAMADEGVDLFLEAGPGDVLTKLAKRCVPGARAISVGSPQDVKTVIDEIGEGS